MDLQLKAQQAFRNKDFETAEQLLLQCVEQKPNDAIILMRLGQVYMAQAKFQESFDSLRKAQQQDPQNPDVYRSLGMAIRMSGLIDLGISYLGTMLTYAPLILQPQVHLTLAELFAVKGDDISLMNSLLLLEKLPPVDNPRMVLRLWGEIHNIEGMKRFTSQYSSLSDLAYGLIHEQSNSSLAIEFLQKGTCSDFWEADLCLYRLTGESIYLSNAHMKAPKTAEVLVEVAKEQNNMDVLQKISVSPVVFSSVRRRAQQILN